MNELEVSPETDYSAAYYDPPRVRWWLLSAIGGVVVGLAFSLLIHEDYRDFVNGLVFDAWGVYFCIWLRRIEPDSKSLFWFSASVAAGFLSMILGLRADPGGVLDGMSSLLGLAEIVLYIAAIYVIRAELVWHYNQREDFTLVLGPVMTLFFSFVYFQYHLYDIAEQRLKERNSITA